MAAHGERVSGVVVMSSVVGEPMVQDTPEQDIVVEELELPPQMDPEPEMGAAAAYDTSPPPLHQNPSPIPAETAHQIAPDMAQLFAMLAVMNNKLDGNTRKMEGMENSMGKKMEGMAQTMREEMQCMGAGLQGGLEQFKKGQRELLRATCWASRERKLLEVTEKVTETVTQMLKGEETTCTRETRRQVTEYTETREIGERLHGVEVGAAHTHTHR